MDDAASRMVDRDTGYSELMRAFGTVGGRYVDVGVREKDGAEVPEGSDATLAAYATYNEFGSEDGQSPPQRSFLRSTEAENRDKYVDMIGTAIGNHLDGRRHINQGLARVGAKVVRDVQAKIRSGVEPANAESTLKRKKSTVTLIDTGRLRQSIDYEVGEGGTD